MLSVRPAQASDVPLLKIYHKLGATFLDDWKTVNLEGEPLQRLAGSASLRL
jgi:hypothetical protein